jgi:hypothetical protein
VVRRRTIQTTTEDNPKERNRRLDIIKCQLHDKVPCQSEELSYNHLTDIGLHMDEVRSVDVLYYSIFHSIASDIMNWPFFLAIVAIDNDEDEDGDAKYN